MSTDARALLDTAAALLRTTAPTLSGEGRYVALLSANAVATASRDLAMAARSDRLLAAFAADPSAIRAGVHDEDVALHDRLIAWSALRAWIADPDTLTAAERSACLEGADDSRP